MNLSALTLTQLRYILAVARCASFSQAARECGVSQPGLSNQVAKLERLLGVVVFDRSQTPVTATAHGSQIIRRAGVVVRAAEALGDAVSSREGELAGVFRLGLIPTVATVLVPFLAPAFAAAHPRVQLTITEHTTADLIALLRADDIDGGIAATPLEVPSISETVLYRERLMAYFPPRHPLARRRKRLRQSDLVDFPLWLLPEGHCFRNQALQLCRVRHALNHPIRGVTYEGHSFETLIRLVDLGHGITLLPELMVANLTAAQRRRSRPVGQPATVREVSLIRSRSALRAEIAEAIAKLVQSCAETALDASATTRARVLKPLS